MLPDVINGKLIVFTYDMPKMFNLLEGILLTYSFI